MNTQEATKSDIDTGRFYNIYGDGQSGFIKCYQRKKMVDFPTEWKVWRMWRCTEVLAQNG